MVEHHSHIPALGNTPGPTSGAIAPAGQQHAHAPDPVQLAGQRALREAQRLARAGHVLVPVTISRTADGKKDARFHIGWRAGGTSRPDVLRDWSVQHPGCSFAVLCGPSGIEVVDLDAAEGGPAWWVQEGMPTSRYVVDTPGGGEHHVWRRRPGAEPDDRLVNNAGKVAPGVDARTVGGLVFAPGSFVIGTDGVPEPRAYTARTDLPEPDRLDETPRAVLALWSRARAARPRREVGAGGDVGQVDQDRRFDPDEAHAYVAREAMAPLLAAEYGNNVNDTLNRSALVLGHFVPTFWSRDEAADALGGWLLAGPGRRNGWTTLDDEDRGSIESGLRRGMAEPYALRSAPGSNALGAVDPVDPGTVQVDLLASTKTALPDATSVNTAMMSPGTDLDVAVARLRVRREAARLVDAEERPPPTPPGSTSLAALLAEPAATTRYRIEGLWPSGGKVLMSAPAKAGKTTLVGNLVRCLADASPFLASPEVTPGQWRVAAAGHAVAPLEGRRIMLLDFEMTRDMLRTWLRDQQIANTAGVEVELMRGRTWDPRDDAQRAAWASYLAERDVAVLIVDPIGPVLNSLGVDESSSSEVGRVLWALDALCAAAGITELFVVHHAGHDGERARGTSGFEGWPDAMWTLVRDKSLEGAGRRALRAAGRDVHLAETVLDLDRATRRLSLGQGSRAVARGSEHAEIIADIVRQEVENRGTGAPGPSTNELKKSARDTAIGTKIQDAQDAIAAARRLGLVHTHDGPNRSLQHYSGGSCEGCSEPSGGVVDPGGP